MKGDDFLHARNRCRDSVKGLNTEDMLMQAADFVSPMKWHLAHTTWFWETFLLVPYFQGYCPFNPDYLWFFNSYYNSLKQPIIPKSKRGVFASRPLMNEIWNYREYVEKNVLSFLQTSLHEGNPKVKEIFELGIHHEHQHHELMHMDLKYNFFMHPLRPKLKQEGLKAEFLNSPVRPKGRNYVHVSEGMAVIGYEGSDFCFDNELPVHKFYVPESAIGVSLVTCGEYLQFIKDGGYENPDLWLSDGWAEKEREGWDAPLYWEMKNGEYYIYTGTETVPLDEKMPVNHISYYEADAFARYAGQRLPTEQEWETAAKRNFPNLNEFEAHFFQNERRTLPGRESMIEDWFGCLWQWTASPYVSYPGGNPRFTGIAEYNSKFMSNQIVLRGGCFVNDFLHFRTTYRNFYYPSARWLFSGIRLAQNYQK